MRNLRLFVMLSFLFSCQNKSTTNYYAFETLNNTLIKSNKTLQKSTETINKSLDDKLYDPTTNIKAAIWQPKAVKIHHLAISVYNFIDSIKQEIKKAAGLKTSVDNEVFELDNKTAVRQILKQRGKQLFGKLISLKDSFFTVDDIIRPEFDTSLFIVPSAYDDRENMREQFLKNYFDDLPAIGALAVLSGLQNNVCAAENRITSLLHSQIAYHPTHYWQWPIINQSSSILKPGEDLKITAGIGEFMVYNNAQAIINGKTVPVNEQGLAEYSFKTAVAGQYKVSVRLSYSDQDGNLRVIDRVLTYTVKND